MSLYRKNLKTERILIPVKADDYSDIFNSYDNRPLENRSIDSDLDDYLKGVFLQIPINKEDEFELEITLPNLKKCNILEYDTKKGILSHYNSFSIYEKNIRKLNIRQIASYILIAFILQFLNYFTQSKYGYTLYSELFSTGATVLLWQVMTIIFIDYKTLKYNKKIYSKLSNLHITFKYI